MLQVVVAACRLLTMVDKEQEEHELAEKDQDEREGAKSTAKNKHDWAAADLEKVKFLMAPYGHMLFAPCCLRLLVDIRLNFFFALK